MCILISDRSQHFTKDSEDKKLFIAIDALLCGFDGLI